MKKTILLISILMISGIFSIWSESGRQIMESVINNQKSNSSAMDLVMNLVDRSGNISTRRLQTLILDDQGQTKTITLFMEPASVKDTRFLTLENELRNDDQWIYLPALRKVKRIAAGEREGSFMGSDFSYSDMSARGGDLDDSDYKILREETYNGYDCFVVESIPHEGTDPVYGKNISWVDKISRLTIKVDFYSLNLSEKIKELIMENLKEVQGHWVGLKTTMTTIATGHKTIVETRQVKYDIPINPGYFTTNFLQTGKARQ
ncbi:MAG: outer membrane lipoprotein-sorting protein [Spirochaetaceae bacterium]|nr:outer membrane lipoprotein-sorting protein [Spirochaetaceae bacterium]